MGLAMTLFLLALLFVIYYRIARTDTAANAQSIVAALVPVVVFILIICGVLFFFLTNRLVLAPIKKIRDAALAVSKGQLNTVISTAQNDEIGDLAWSVDQMANALQRDIQSLKEVDKLKSEFIAISSHNLRTPLASIQSGLEMLQTAQVDAEARKILEIIRTSTVSLIAFSEDMLTIASIEAQEGPGQQVSVLLGDVLAPLIANAAVQAEKRKIAFTTSLQAQAVAVHANVTLLRLAFRNLLDNACKFTSAGGSITVTSRQENNHVIVSVKDTGIGIARDEIPNLFTKFHRGTATLTYDYEGIGMGLYMAKLIFDQHHASIAVDSVQNEGTEMTVSLPVSTAAKATTPSPASAQNN